MTRNTVFGLFALAVLLAVAGFIFKADTATVPDNGSVSSNVEETEIRNVVTEFGTKLEAVSLLSPTRAQDMTREYDAYLTPELLEKWKPEGADALGRYASSPWPDSIDIVEVRKEGDEYIVEANIIEVTNTDEGDTPAAVQPVSLTMQKIDGAWKISKMSKGSYSELPHRQSIVGFWECLPHKDTSGPQTMECAFGIAVDQSDGHYAVDTSLMSTYPVDYASGTKVRVSGIVTPANQLSGVQKYDIDGIIRATEIEQI